MTAFNPAHHARGPAGRFAATVHAEPGLTLDVPRTGDLIGTGTLKKRHPAWTPAAVTRFLGEPDKLITNPVVRSQGKMRMYLESRVAEVEAKTEWASWVSAHAQRVSRVGAVRGPRPDLIGRGRTGDYPVTR